jgi:muramoyltetrapeptide carboxypeptidase
MQHPDQTYTLEEVITRVLGDLGIPVAFGLRSGHVQGENITLPIGVRAKLAAQNEVRLSILEPATAARAAKGQS